MANYRCCCIKRCIYCCLQDVDREQLSSTVLKLISSVASTAPTDDKSRDAVWHPTVTFTVSQDQYQDPLGFGTIDLLNMKLVRRQFEKCYNTTLGLAVATCG
jgi:hypothetical protein